MTDIWLKRRSAWSQQQDDARDEFDVDYGRVVHSGSFRRLQGKTQILNLGDSDFYRTRMMWWTTPAPGIECAKG